MKQVELTRKQCDFMEQIVKSPSTHGRGIKIKDIRLIKKIADTFGAQKITAIPMPEMVAIDKNAPTEEEKQAHQAAMTEIHKQNEDLFNSKVIVELADIEFGIAKTKLEGFEFAENFSDEALKLAEVFDI